MKKKTNIEEWVSTNGLANPSHPLTDEQCNQFRRMPLSFNEMIRYIFAAGCRHGVDLSDETLDQAFKTVTGSPDIAGGEKTVLGEHRRLLAEKIPDVVKGLYPK